MLDGEKKNETKIMQKQRFRFTAYRSRLEFAVVARLARTETKERMKVTDIVQFAAATKHPHFND